MRVKIERFVYSTMGTFGVLYVDDVPLCYTVERPWRQNKPNVSCVPEGDYKLTPRMSGVMKRTTRDRFDWGFEVGPVLNRTYIMIHPANMMSDLEGCVGVGKHLGVVHSKWAVTKSQAAYSELVEKLSRETHDIEITFNPAACDAYGG